VKALRDLTLLCALLFGLLWFTNDPSTATTAASSEQLVPEQTAMPLSAAALLPLGSRVQATSQSDLPVIKSLGSYLLTPHAYHLTNALAPLTALSATQARGWQEAQKRRLLFPFHEFV